MRLSYIVTVALACLLSGYDEVVASHETLTEKVASNRLRQSSQEKTVDDDWRSMRTYRVTGRPVGSTVAKKNSGDYDIQEERSPFTIFVRDVYRLPFNTVMYLRGVNPTWNRVKHGALPLMTRRSSSTKNAASYSKFHGGVKALTKAIKKFFRKLLRIFWH
ncbi:hypothetical protein Plhal304r1_c003g0011391 [Plasmopara halstedii]